MEIITIQIASVGVNSYLIYDRDIKEALIIDPGDDYDHIANTIDDHGLDLKYILLTHSHGDHIGACQELMDNTGTQLAIHKDELDMIKDPNLNLSNLILQEDISLEPDILLEDKDQIKINDLTVDVIHTPGHSPGGLSFKIDNNIFVGDALFKGSIGRTDLYKGDYQTLISSIISKILVYDDDTTIYPGHGPRTSIGYEKKTNPFLQI